MSGKWYQKHTKDHYVKEANKQGLRSRAVFKLQEIQTKHTILKRGDCVLDLGSAPGAWSESLAQMVGHQGLVAACDILDMQPIKGVHFIQGDFLAADTKKQIIAVSNEFDVIVSDMAPNLTGTEVTDQANMFELVEQVTQFCHEHLKQDGRLLMKVFSGSMINEVVMLFKNMFNKVKTVKPSASRQASKEIYLIGEGFRV
ncbi:MAG: RlmE family RNA methyltransferase [Pseudomonadota bacterium]|nr:RlmE family RNA methyltransferase [Pseudomonadota bacterium]